MSNVMGFRVVNETAEALEIDVYDVIGDGWFGGVSAKMIRDRLKNTKASAIKLRVNSPGGDVLEGFAIYNLLNEHKARVEVDIDGLAASIASVIIMAADEIRIASNAMVMVHNPWSCFCGESDDFRAMADLLDKMQGSIADAYAARTGQTRAKCIELMNASTWMTATEAKALGFVDTVKSSKGTAAKKTARAQAQMFAALDLSAFDDVPAHIVEAVAAHRAQPELPLVTDDETNDQPIAERDETETTSMNEAQIFAALGVTTLAEAQARIAVLSKIEKAIGKAGDEAHGAIVAVIQDAAEVTTLRASVASLQKAVDGNELDKAIAQAKADKKITPNDEAVIRAQVAEGEITIKGAKALLDRKSPHPVLAAADKVPAQASTDAVDAEKFAAMSGPERAALKKADPALYAELLAATKK